MKLFNSTLLSLALILAVAPVNAAQKTTAQKVADKAKVVGWAGAAGVLGIATLLHIYTSAAFTPIGVAFELKKPIDLPINEIGFHLGTRCSQLIIATSGAALTYNCFKNFKAALAEAKKENQEKTA